MPHPATLGKPAGRRRLRAIAGSLAVRFRRLHADRSGSAMTLFALSLPALVGFAGLGTEAAGWYLTKRAMQGAADSAAAAAATALGAGVTNNAVLISEGTAVAAEHNFVNGSNGTTVTVNHPPASGVHMNDPNAVEVTISRQEKPLLSSLFLSKEPTISARAVARADRSLTAEACVVALDKQNETGMTVSGSVDLNFPGCSLYINSPSAAALSVNGNAAKIKPKTAYIVGGRDDKHNGLQPANGINTGVTPLIDPYKNVAVPAFSGCNQNNYKPKGNEKIEAGASGVYVFCGGLKMSGNPSLTLGPGTYIIDSGDFDIQNGSLTATSGTTIILTKSPGKACATSKITGGTINIVAPSSGNLAGIAIYKDRTCINHDKDDDKVAGNATLNITGAIYFPEQYVEFAGGSSAGGAICTQLVAWRIKFTGNSGFQNNCAGTGTRKLVRIGGRLAE